MKIAVPAGLICVTTTVIVDSIFWGRLLWPEGEVLWFNTIMNRSHEYGVSFYTKHSLLYCNKEKQKYCSLTKIQRPLPFSGTFTRPSQGEWLFPCCFYLLDCGWSHGVGSSPCQPSFLSSSTPFFHIKSYASSFTYFLHSIWLLPRPPKECKQLNSLYLPDLKLKMPTFSDGSTETNHCGTNCWGSLLWGTYC